MSIPRLHARSFFRAGIVRNNLEEEMATATAVRAAERAARKDADDPIRREYELQNAWGLHSAVDLHGCDAALIRDAGAIRRFVVELCDRIEMKRFGECVVVNFGEEERVAGYSMTQLIETSLISAHFANQSNAVYLDVFSCKYYDPRVVAEFAKVFFKAKDYRLSHTFRA